MAKKILKVGIVGCGGIAQMMYLPYLNELEEFKVVSLCDISKNLVDKISDYYNIEKRYTNAHTLINQKDIEAVIVLTRDHADIAIEAANNGKHVLVEKPMCLSIEEANKMVKASKKNNVKIMVAYMKRYDPGFEYGKKLLKKGDIKLICIHDLPHYNPLIKNEVYNIFKYDDVPKNVIEEMTNSYFRKLEKAISSDNEDFINAFNWLLMLGSHDVSILTGVFGYPKKVLFTDVWHPMPGPDGYFIESFLDYGNDKKCIFVIGNSDRKWFEETLTGYSSKDTISISFPSPFLKNAPTKVKHIEMKGEIIQEKEMIASFEEAFKRELLHFYDCVVNDKKPQTDVKVGEKDIILLTDIISKYMQRIK
jgi:predicted dehydrogenase